MIKTVGYQWKYGENKVCECGMCKELCNFLLLVTQALPRVVLLLLAVFGEAMIIVESVNDLCIS